MMPNVDSGSAIIIMAGTVIPILVLIVAVIIVIVVLVLRQVDNNHV